LTENAAPSKLQGWKTREWKTQHQVAGVENAAPDDKGGKRGSGKCGTKFRGVFRISSLRMEVLQWSPGAKPR